MATQHYRLTCLSPVHVGTGQQMMKFDGAFEQGRWHVIDLDAVFARGIDADEIANAMSNTAFAWADWLHGRRLQAGEVALYSLPCPQDPRDVGVREAIKTVYLQPYIPGTTLKGAIRTAILWHLLRNDQQMCTFAADYLLLAISAREIAAQVKKMTQNDSQKQSDPAVHRKAIQQVIDVDDADVEELLKALYQAMGKRLQQGQVRLRDIEGLGRDERFLALPIERQLLGKDPNHDLMRTVHVLDTEPTDLEHMAVQLVWTYTIRQNRLVEKREQEGEYKNFAECIQPDTTLSARIDRDDYLLGQAGERLQYTRAGIDAVLKMPEVCNRYAEALIQREKEFFARYQLNPLRDFYQRLEQRLKSLPKGAFLLNIGWGGGWEAKTVGDLLRETMDEDEFKDLRRRYRLGTNPSTNQIDWNAPFPKTRLIAYRNGASAYPLGWVLLEPV